MHRKYGLAEEEMKFVEGWSDGGGNVRLFYRNNVITR